MLKHSTMNVINLLTFESKKLNDSQIQSIEMNAFVANSIRQIIEEVFMQLAPSFIIVVSSRRIRPLNFFLNVLQHIFNNIEDMNIQLVFLDYQKPQRIDGPRFVNLLFIDSFEAFLDIDVISYTKNYNANEYYHIFLMQRDLYINDDMQKIFDYCWYNNIIHCNVEYQNSESELHLVSYFPYGPEECGNTSPQHINQFVGDRWLRQPSFLPKLDNFYGCPLVGVLRLSPPFAYLSGGKKWAFNGLEVALIRLMAVPLNCSLTLKVAQEDDRNLPATGGALQMLGDHTANFVFGYYRKRAVAADLFTTTMPHYHSSVVAAINYNSHKLSSFEVLTFPFGAYTWCAMLASFILSLMVTKLMRRRHPRAIRSFSIVATTFGIPITDASSRLETIFIFTPWLWATLMLRSIYSGLLYHLFSNAIYQRLPLTLYGATNAGYRTVMNEFTFKDVQDVSYYNLSNHQQNTLVIPSLNEMAPLDYLVKHDKDKIFGVVAQEFLMHYMEVNNKAGLFYTIPDIMMQQQLCFYLPKHSFLISKFDAIIMDLRSVGLFKILEQRYLNSKNLPNPFAVENKMIHHQDLYGIYITCGGLYSIALAVFLLEFISKRMICLRKVFE